MKLQNLHTHTNFCDGANTPEEMVQAARLFGMDSLGFSGHSPLLPPLPGDWCMKAEQMEDYRKEVLRLREKYAGEVEIFLGLEQDALSPQPMDKYDYIIGSVHGLITPEGTLAAVDESQSAFCQAVEEHYGGDPLRFAESYYKEVGQVVQKTGCQIVGHFDLITKFNEGNWLFQVTHPRYQKAALEALDQLAAENVVLEVNTGAMSRGYRKAPYPEISLLREMNRRKIPICITSDCHSAQTLVHGFTQAARLAESCGYRECMYWTKQGFVPGPMPE